MEPKWSKYLTWFWKEHIAESIPTTGLKYIDKNVASNPAIAHMNYNELIWNIFQLEQALNNAFELKWNV